MRFDVFRPKRADLDVLLLDVQADLLSNLRTRMVIPLTASAEVAPLKRLHPSFDIGGRRYVMMTTDMSSVATSELGPQVASLAAHHTEIIGAIDFLLLGY
jgi:toxin CcdB